jgi:hypothetical protein
MTDIPDILALVHFYAASEGGRKDSTRSDTYRCPLKFGGELFDCVLLLADIGPLNPGSKAIVPIRFLFPEIIVPRLNSGDHFLLWEGRTVAEGVVLEVTRSSG